MDKMVYASQISDLISAIIIYFCSFVFLFRHLMNQRAQKMNQKNINAETDAAEADSVEDVIAEDTAAVKEADVKGGEDL